jgi:hypothetical protein
MGFDKKYSKLASAKEIEIAIKGLEANGMNVIDVGNRDEAKKEVLAMVPMGAEVFTMTSVTLEEAGIAKEINESGNYNSVRNRLSRMDRDSQRGEMLRIGAAPEYAIGSVHAITENGEVMIASNSGSQLGAYAYGAGHVIWVVGAQKIVKNVDEGMKRIYDYCLPLESERAKKAYGLSGSSVSKILIVNKEVVPDRVTVIIVREKMGF